MFDEQDFEGLDPEQARLIYQPGKNPETDAWFNGFFIENHLDYYTNPDHACTPEQIRFMVYTEDNEQYYPCSDKMFEAIMHRNKSAFLQKKYNEVFQRLLALIDRQIEDPWEKSFLESLIIIKFKHETRDEIMIPSRVEKRLLGMFLKRTQIEDPYVCDKVARNRRALQVLASPAFQTAINRVTENEFERLPTRFSEIKKRVDYIELRRLISLCVERTIWETDEAKHYTVEDYHKILERPLSGRGVGRFFQFFGLDEEDHSGTGYEAKKILWLVDESGEFLIDLYIIRYLEKLGHKIIIAFKGGPLYTKIDFVDLQEDEILKKETEGIYMIHENAITKNQLISLIRSDHNILAISDSTRENVNLILASVTFARIFKEVDVVISRGADQKRRFFETHFQFTQDIYNISANQAGFAEISHKSMHPNVKKFSYKDLEIKAQRIIDEMKAAKKDKMTVVFYSGIIGSIPGKVEMAKQVMAAFVKYLKDQYAMTFIINPSEYFEPGMDADDLMYMWEIVQRSGYIDIWRFQTYEDIALSFQLMNIKIPPEWVGKDATYSTGCTKEMRIALEVQQLHPEMQIIGPSREKFMRRSEYGIGKLYDKRLVDTCTI
ncbi:MAG: hypothetical protein R6U50_06610 [Desulfobacterales bacterium]